MTNPILSAALRYAKEGIGVFPIMGKKPVTYDGFYSASTVKEVIEAWFENNPDWGVAARIPDWAVVLDVDTDGHRSIKTAGYDIPDTASTKSRRGKHYWFELPEGHPNGVRKVGWLPDVELLGNKGYVVMPPSRHPSGTEYEEIVPIKRSMMEMAPDWLLTGMHVISSEKEKVRPSEMLAGIPAGQRQNGLFRYACELRARPKMHVDEAKALVHKAAEASGSGDYNTDKLVDRVWKVYEGWSDQPVSEKEKPYSWAELFALGLPPTQFLVDKLIQSEGCSMLFAPPKKWKSCAASQLAICVATGEDFLGRSVRQSEVLYCDLQQDKEAANERYRTQLRSLGVESPPYNLHSWFALDPSDQGGLASLSNFLSEHPACGLIIIDIIKDIWPVELGGGTAPDQDRIALRPFHKLAKEYGVAILMIHHARKSFSGSDFFETISGSQSIFGDMKTVIGISGAEFNPSCEFLVKGKNIPMQKVKVRMEERELVWKLDHAL